jgi:isopenicillin-N epimerase
MEMHMSVVNWAEARQQMHMDPSIAYLNAGSYGLTPRPVVEHVTYLREQMYFNPTDFIWRKGGELLWHAREKLAEHLRVDPKRLIFVENVSVGINIVAATLRLTTPGEILMTNHEYGAMHWAWERAAARQGLTLRIVKLPLEANDPAAYAQAIVNEIRPETRLLFLSHVYFTMGLVLPLAEICAAARKQGVFTMIDAAHAPGMLDLDLPKIGADFYSANLHKWMLAPVGSGFMYVAPGNEDRIQPLQVSWGWHYDRAMGDVFNKDDVLIVRKGGTPRLWSYEFEGSRDITPWMTMPTVLWFHDKWGWENIRQRHRELSDYVRQRLDGLCGLKLVTPNHPQLRGGLTAFKLPRNLGQPFRNVLWEKYKIELNLIEHRDGHLLRTSTHYYNTPEEVDRLAMAIEQEMPNM